jgi:hypothetical protein
MKNPAIKRIILIITSVFTFFSVSQAQRYLSDYDSTLFIRDTVRPLAQRFNNIHLSGYIQPQFQVIQTKGAEAYNGGNFSTYSNSRFMLRRARIKLDYIIPSKQRTFPTGLFTFQFDVTERGVSAKDIFLRIYEPKGHQFSFSLGLFARPFGYEVNLSSAFRETPERARMSQILMPGERDLGGMVSFEPLNKKTKLPVKFDLGLFNGQGTSGPTDFDSFKDLVSRLKLKPVHVSENVFISGGLSLLKGGWMQGSKYKYSLRPIGGANAFVLDSAASNFGAKATRNYYGADLQLAHVRNKIKTELRGEYWSGNQPGTALSTTSPGTLPPGAVYLRNFDGATFYLLQNLFSEKWELMVKYDWYDPNVKVSGTDIGKAGLNLNQADIRYATLGFGLSYFMNQNLKMLVYHELVKNESTSLAGFGEDKKDNLFTFRMQLRF